MLILFISIEVHHLIMARIFSFEKHLQERHFDKQVVKKIKELNPLFDFRTDNKDGLAFLHLKDFTCIFFTYIPRTETTYLPTINQSLNGIKETSGSYSTGEWYVNKIYRLSQKEYLKIIPLVYKKDKKKGWISELKNKIKKTIND